MTAGIPAGTNVSQRIPVYKGDNSGFRSSQKALICPWFPGERPKIHRLHGEFVPGLLAGLCFTNLVTHAEGADTTRGPLHCNSAGRDAGAPGVQQTVDSERHNSLDKPSFFR